MCCWCAEQVPGDVVLVQLDWPVEVWIFAIANISALSELYWPAEAWLCWWSPDQGPSTPAPAWTSAAAGYTPGSSRYSCNMVRLYWVKINMSWIMIHKYWCYLFLGEVCWSVLMKKNHGFCQNSDWRQKGIQKSKIVFPNIVSLCSTSAAEGWQW